MSKEEPEVYELNILPLDETYLCPISKTLLTDPVNAEDGHTYDRETIIEYFKHCIEQKKPTASPLTGNPMGSNLV